MKKRIVYLNHMQTVMFILIWGYLTYSTTSMVAFGKSNDMQLDISVSVTKNYLLAVRNLKPADTVKRNLIIHNNGSRDYSYATRVERISKDAVLYDKLELNVRRDGKVLFDGLMRNFNGLAVSKLNSGESSTIQFEVHVPYELGNEYQGKAADLKLTFMAEGRNKVVEENGSGAGKAGTASKADGIGEELPSTATNLFNIMLAGGVLFLSGAGVLIFIKLEKSKIGGSKDV